MVENPCQPPLKREQIPAALQAAGISPTAQRIEIAALLLERTQHMSADQVIARLSEADASVSKATVYNTLGLFARMGLVREVMVDATRVFYDSNTAPHYHFFNIDDGVLTDVPVQGLAIDNLPAPPPGTTTEMVDVVIRIRNDA